MGCLTAERQPRLYLHGRSTSDEDWAIFIWRKVCRFYKRLIKANCTPASLTEIIHTGSEKLPTWSWGISPGNCFFPSAGSVRVLGELLSAIAAKAADYIFRNNQNGLSVIQICNSIGCWLCNCIEVVNGGSNCHNNSPTREPSFAWRASYLDKAESVIASPAVRCWVRGLAIQTVKNGLASIPAFIYRLQVPNFDFGNVGDLSLINPVFQGGMASACG